MAAANRPLRVLFLCTGNACRSQMAEGWARALRGRQIEAYSAGTSPHGMNRLAMRAMSEAGVDISSHSSKHVATLMHVPFDYVVTVCDSASESCPIFPGNAKVLHNSFEDPPKLARNATSDDEAMPHYRRVRDEIRTFVETLPAALTSPAKSCCGPACCEPALVAASAGSFEPSLDLAHQRTRDHVREGYAAIARTGCCGPSGGGCCGPSAFTPEQLAQAIGYSQGELAAMPDGANMGLSCGNPTVLASLRPGEIVLDLGSGGGFDCFVAGPKVGSSGRVIGVDMTPDMLRKARGNLASYTGQTGLANVEFRLGEIEALPVADASVDVVISNCVLNLSPDKPRVWREIARVLRPGGRVAVSDLALLRSLPEAVRSDVEALVGCVAGAVLVEETREQAATAGLADIVVRTKPDYINALTNWDDPLYVRIAQHLPKGTSPSDFITSLDITATKP